MRRATVVVLVLTSALGMAVRADEAKGGGGVAGVAKGNNAFAVDLYGKLRERPGNLFLSPYSISTALAMTYAGARGETAEQMARTLHFGGPAEELHRSFERLSKQIGGEGEEKRPYQLSVANALWGQEGDPFRPEFLELVEKHYGAGLRRVDFRATEQARRIINAWVEEETRGKIQDLLKSPHPSPDTSLVLTNAIYFKGDWATPFRKEATKAESFALAGGGKVEVPMMHQMGRFSYHDAGRFHALGMPYAGDALEMVVLLPKEGDGLARMEAALTEKAIAEVIAKRGPRRVDVALPRFKVEAGFELQDALSALGMPLAFTGSADFSGMNGRRDLFISAVIHKAFADVNEEGTEAAAATAVVMTRAAAARPEPVVTFRADHPFVFLIRDLRNGSLLFLGRVADPRS
jgi:serpin B